MAPNKNTDPAAAGVKGKVMTNRKEKRASRFFKDNVSKFHPSDFCPHLCHVIEHIHTPRGTGRISGSAVESSAPSWCSRLPHVPGFVVLPLAECREQHPALPARAQGFSRLCLPTAPWFGATRACPQPNQSV